MALIKHHDRTPELVREWPSTLLGAFPRWFDDIITDAEGRGMIKVEQFTDDGSVVVRAELPGIDPDKDVEVTVDDGALHIRAERREEEETSGRSFRRRELRYGSFARTVPLPEGVDEDAITATYKDGILEVRAALPPEAPKEAARRVKIGHG